MSNSNHTHTDPLPVHKTQVFMIENLCCANCAAKMESKIAALPGIEEAVLTFTTRQLRITAADPLSHLEEIQAVCARIEEDVIIRPREERTARNARPTPEKMMRRSSQTDSGSTCECGHEHGHKHEHHQHSEDCGCGHEHHHEHHKHSEDCGCGHEHHHEHHEHSEDCGCGHEHHHEHHKHSEDCDCKHEHHEHSEDCGCGHEHHEHSEDCGCGHEHHHEHHKHSEDCGCGHEHHKHSEGCRCGHEHSHSHESHEGHPLREIVLGAVLFLTGIILEKLGVRTLFTAPIQIIAYLILGRNIVKTAFRNLIRGQVFDENFLMSIATLGAFCIQNFEEAVGVMLFFRIGEYFEEKAVEKSRSQIMEAIDLRPEVVHLLSEGDIQTIPAEEALPGDQILVRPGDRIPLDGVVLEGESRIDTSPLTGEPVPVAAYPGKELMSGCVNTSGQLILEVSRPLSESMVTRILDSVENAAASKPKLDRFITRFARIYTPIVVALALGTAILPSLITGDWNYWVYTALSFLVMSCPCALVLSIPLAFFSGIGAGSKCGILFKGGASLEFLSKVRTVILDKTGTITRGDFQLHRIVPAAELSEEQLLQVAAICECNSTHPIAASIITAARERQITYPAPEELEEIPGHGIHARFEGHDYLCGNHKLMKRFGIDLPEISLENAGAEVLVACDGHFLGHLLIADTLKPDATSGIRRLRSMQISTVMLTGDSQANAEAVARETGIDEVHARLLPDEKLEKLQEIRAKRGSVLFVGDGINDAPVLAGADVGAAMGTGADAAIEAADVVFMTSHVEAIPQAIDIAHATQTIAIQNVVFALVIKIGVMILGLCGHASMWAAVFADTGVAMICILNSIRILYRKKFRSV